MSDDAAVFRAAFPTIQSAIKIYGDRQGMRVQLDIPESEMGEAVKLLMWREQVLVVTVRPEKGRHEEEVVNSVIGRTAAKKRIQ